jgi:SYP7 family syntaxin
MAPVPPGGGLAGGKTDGFTQMFASMRRHLDDLNEKSEGAKSETNRAALAAINAEIRRGKNFLRGELPKLRKAMAKRAKGLSEEDKRSREESVDQMEYDVERVPDGVNRSAPVAPGRRPVGGGAGGSGGAGAGGSGVSVDVSNLDQAAGQNMEHSEQSRAFRAEFEASKRKQDEGLDEISKGLGVLKNLTGEMDEEIKRQTPIMDVIDDKLDNTSAELATANGKLKKVITTMRSTRHFCVDVILIFIILGIGMYLFSSLN